MKVYDPDSPQSDDALDEARTRDLLGWEDEAPIRVRGIWFRLARGFIVLAVVVFLLWTAYSRARSWFDEQLDPPGEAGPAIELVVPAGATTADIARQLEDLDVIPNSTFFRYYARAKDEGNFQAGEYTMPTNASVEEAIAVLNGGPRPQETTRFTVREGLWEDEIIASIASQLDNVTEAQLWAALDSGAIPARYRPDGVASYEGLLFPDTYEVNAEATAEEVLLKMANEFTSVTGDLGYGGADTLIGYSAYEVLIVASLIEAETRVPEERPQVASVIYNRLREQWPLGIDATCIYNGFDLPTRVGDRAGLRAELDVADDERLVVHPARAIARKNIGAALDLCADLGATYWLTGRAEEGYDDELARLLGEARCRVIRRPVPDRVDLYAAADLVAFPSTWEGFGNPPVEAALHRRPVAVGDYPVAAELRSLGFDWPFPDECELLAAELEAPDRGRLDRNFDVAERHLSAAAMTEGLQRLLERAGWWP